MDIFASIGERLTLAGRRIRAWSWPTRLAFLMSFVASGLLSNGDFIVGMIAAALCCVLFYWGDAIEVRRQNAAQR